MGRGETVTRHRLEDGLLDKISELVERRDTLQTQNAELLRQNASLISTVDQLMDHITSHCADPECRLLPSAEPDTPEPPRRGLLGRKLPGKDPGKSDSAKSTEGETP